MQWNRDLSFLKGTEKTNDECGKTTNPNTWCFEVLRSPNLFKKTTHHRKLKMQSFLNVITL